MLTAHCPPLTAHCFPPSGAPGTMVALKTNLRMLSPRLSSLGSCFVFVNVILKPVSFEPFVTAPRQA